MHRDDRFNLQSIKRGFSNWPITSATYLSSPPTPPSEIMTTGKIHLSAHWPRYQYCAPYPARMRVLSRVAVHRRKNERRDKSSGSRSHDRASGKIQGGTSVSVKFTTNIFLPPPPENRVEFTCRVSAAEHAPCGREWREEDARGARIYLCATHPRVRNIERNNPPRSYSSAKQIPPLQDPIYSCKLRGELRQSPRNSIRDGLFRLISRRNFGFV